MTARARHLLSALVILWPLAVPATAQTIFPTDGLERRIDFWKQVYTKYGADDVIVHDRVHVNLIYAVANDDTADDTVRSVKESLREIRDRLSAPEELSERATGIRQAIVDAELEPSAALLNDLLDNIHTQRGVKERFRGGIVRSGRYVDAFQRIMEAHDVPPAFALLPLVESSYENARSKAAAVGVWQFTRAASHGYLQVGRRADERLDPIKSAQAAAKLVKSHYDVLGSWPLAVTAYNHGRGGMLRARAETGSDLPTIISAYRGPLFGYASMNFYAEFVAAIDVYEHRQDYFGTLALERPAASAVTKVASARPVEKVSAAKVMAAAKTAAPKAASSRTTSTKPSSYTVRRGDTLSDIANRFGTSIQRLAARNKIAGHSIFAGQILVIR